MCEPDGSHKVQQVEQEGTFNAGCMNGKERASKLLPTMLYDGVSGYPVTRHDEVCAGYHWNATLDHIIDPVFSGCSGARLPETSV